MLYRVLVRSGIFVCNITVISVFVVSFYNSQLLNITRYGRLRYIKARGYKLALQILLRYKNLFFYKLKYFLLSFAC